MEWSKLFANLPDEPRVQAADDAELGSFGLLVQGFCYCTSAESRGFIPATQVPRFGGRRLRQRVAALAGQGLWIPVQGGWLLDPDLWNEDKNLSDSAEKKRQADRERIAAKRAAVKAAQNGTTPDLSRDSRTTRRATRSRDSRTVEKSREEKTRSSPADVGNQSPDRNARGEPGIDEITETIIKAVYEATSRVVDPPWAARIRDHILEGHKAGNPAAYVRAVIENDPDPYTRFLPLYEGTP